MLEKVDTLKSFEIDKKIEKKQWLLKFLAY